VLEAAEGGAHAKTICNTNFYGHIHVLLIKTNSIIYNMLYNNNKIQCQGLPGGACAKTICNTNFYGHICVLLVKTNSMIHI